jgi:hypothetical protein
MAWLIWLAVQVGITLEQFEYHLERMLRRRRP